MQGTVNQSHAKHTGHHSPAELRCGCVRHTGMQGVPIPGQHAKESVVRFSDGAAVCTKRCARLDVFEIKRSHAPSPVTAGRRSVARASEYEERYFTKPALT